MYIETWWKIWCPKCKKANWLCGGDMSDMTVPDTEGLECWSCQEKTPLESEEMLELLDTDLENMYYEEGQEKPK